METNLPRRNAVENRYDTETVGASKLGKNNHHVQKFDFPTLVYVYWLVFGYFVAYNRNKIKWTRRSTTTEKPKNKKN